MMFPTITVKAMNVELNKERNDLITRRLAPIARLLPESNDVHFDVVIRKVDTSWMGERYCVSVRLKAASETYYAISNETYFERCFARVRDELRRSISKSYKTKEQSMKPMRRFIKERQYLELFA